VLLQDLRLGVLVGSVEAFGQRYPRHSSSAGTWGWLLLIMNMTSNVQDTYGQLSMDVGLGEAFHRGIISR
jgi:hypothetical protein